MVSRAAEGRRGRRAEHRVTGDERRVHGRRRAGCRSAGTRYRGVVVTQSGGVVVPVHARRSPASLGWRRLSCRGAPGGGGGGEVKERGVVDGAERRETCRRDERAGRSKHVGRLLAFLPFRSTILKPHLHDSETELNNEQLL